MRKSYESHFCLHEIDKAFKGEVLILLAKMYIKTT